MVAVLALVATALPRLIVLGGRSSSAILSAAITLRLIGF